MRRWLLALCVAAVVPLLAHLRAGFRPDGPGGLYKLVRLALGPAWILVAALTVVRERQLNVRRRLTRAG
jgi:hypothetical protein